MRCVPALPYNCDGCFSPDDDSVSDDSLSDDPFVALYDDLVYDRTPLMDDFDSLDVSMLDGLSIHHVKGNIRVYNVLVDPTASTSYGMLLVGWIRVDSMTLVPI